MGCASSQAGKVQTPGIIPAAPTEPAQSSSSSKAAQGGGTSTAYDFSKLPEDAKDLPPFFAEILLELMNVQGQLGGLQNFSDYPTIDHKVKAKEFQNAYTDYEYIYLTVLGIGRLHMNAEEIVRKNNGENFTKNPGVQMLERISGMTMHGNRDGANALLRNAPASLLEAFQTAKTRKGGLLEFFKGAFDRSADPCLEGRTGRIMEYLEGTRKGDLGGAGPPWEDVSLRPLPEGTPPRDVTGEHLRVFMNECTWRWATDQKIKYEDAKKVRLDDCNAASFTQLYNTITFKAYMQARGVVVAGGATKQWETLTEEGQWSAYDENANAEILRGEQQGQTKIWFRSGAKGWKYELDLTRMVQRNPKTGKERAVRCQEKTEGSAPLPAGKISREDLDAAVEFFLSMDTLSAPPAEGV